MSTPLLTFTFVLRLPFIPAVKALDAIAARQAYDRICARLLTAMQAAAGTAAPVVTFTIGEDTGTLARLDTEDAFPSDPDTYFFDASIPMRATVSAPDALTARRKYQRVRAHVTSALRAEFATASPGMWFIIESAPARLTLVNGSTDFTTCEACAVEDERGYLVNSQCTRRSACPAQCDNDGCTGRTDDGEGYDGECGNCADVRAAHEDGAHQGTPRADCADCADCALAA